MKELLRLRAQALNYNLVIAQHIADVSKFGNYQNRERYTEMKSAIDVLIRRQ